MRKVFSLIMVAFVALALTACSGKKDDTAPTIRFDEASTGVDGVAELGVYSRAFTISGIVADEGGVKKLEYVQDGQGDPVTISLDDGTEVAFSKDFTMAATAVETSIEFFAYDEANNQGKKTIVVTYIRTE